MLEGGRIVGGSFIALVLGAGPAWFASSRGSAAPSLARPVEGTACVEPAAVMRRTHPAILAGWRERALRNGARSHRASDGRWLEISLSGTCLGCHGTADAFCERCHAEVGVSLSCWDCHSSSGPRGAASAR